MTAGAGGRTPGAAEAPDPGHARCGQNGRLARRLSDLPDWQYLLMEFHRLYRYGSSGGSGRIRRHMASVRDRLGRAFAADPGLAFRPPDDKPVTAHLPRALDTAIGTPMELPARTVSRLAGTLTWEWGYRDMPEGLDRRFAFAELLGPHGPVLCDDLILGLVLFAPGVTYPPHSHEGIEESYVVLSGAISENDAGVFVPGSMILNGAGQEHAITTQRREPALLAYAWIGPTDRLAEPGMTFSRS
jgi:dimethylpropiothetin dethiomethylase